MVTILFASLVVLALLVIAIYFWQKAASATNTKTLPAAPGRALFSEGTPSGIALAAAEAAAEETAKARQLRSKLLEGALAGEKATLQEALAKDETLYDEVMAALLANADSSAALLSLVSYVVRNALPVTKELAKKFIDSSHGVIERSTVAKMLHVAALADDAVIYHKAVETALKAWRKGLLSDVSAPELRSILEGEFWILSSPTRSSGAGFLLKRELANARRELAAAHSE